MDCRLLRSGYTALIVSRVSAVVAETTLFAITVWKLLPHLSINHKALRSPTMKLKGLASIMLHDGVSTFILRRAAVNGQRHGIHL